MCVYIYIYVYISLCALLYVCTCVNTRSMCNQRCALATRLDACVPVSTIQVIFVHRSQITPPPFLHTHCRGVQSSVFSLFVCDRVCVACVCPISNCLYIHCSSQFSRGCVVYIYTAVRDLLRGICRRAFTLLQYGHFFLFFFERERERHPVSTKKLSIMRDIRIVWTGRFILVVCETDIETFCKHSPRDITCTSLELAALFVIVDIRALQTVRYRYIRFQVFHECSN